MIVYKDNYKRYPLVGKFCKENNIGYFIGYARNAGLLQNKENMYSYDENILEEIEFLLNKVHWLDEKKKTKLVVGKVNLSKSNTIF